VRFEFIAKHRGAWRTRDLCEALGVSRGGFYEWLRRPQSRRSRENLQLLALVRTSFEQSDRTYGSPRVWRDLRAWGQRCGRHRVARLMRAEGLRARHRRRRFPSDAGQRLPSAIAPNLLERQFEATAPNQRLGRRLHVHLDPRGLVVFRGGTRLVLALGRRLVDE